MKRLIDKDALVAEIEKQRQLIFPRNTGEMKVADVPKPLEQGWLNALSWIKKIIDTLEVKGVDLDGISRHYALNNSPWDDCRDEIQDAYKAGFELGLKVTQKGEIV